MFRHLFLLRFSFVFERGRQWSSWRSLPLPCVRMSERAIRGHFGFYQYFSTLKNAYVQVIPRPPAYGLYACENDDNYG